MGRGDGRVVEIYLDERGGRGGCESEGEAEGVVRVKDDVGWSYEVGERKEDVRSGGSEGQKKWERAKQRGGGGKELNVELALSFLPSLPIPTHLSP